MKKQHVQDAAKELHALVDAFCEQWLRGHESDKQNWPLKIPEGEWWDQFLMYAQTQTQLGSRGGVQPLPLEALIQRGED